MTQNTIPNAEGFTNVLSGQMGDWIQTLKPYTHRVYFEDFQEGVVISTVGAGTSRPDWTEIGSTTDCPVTATLPDAVTMTTIATGNKGGLLGLTNPALSFPAGKRFAFETRFKVSKGSGGTAGAQNFALGIAKVPDTLAHAATQLTGPTATYITDGFLFYKPSTGLNIDLWVLSASAATLDQASVTTYADTTWQTLGLSYDGATLKAFSNGNLVYSATAPTMPAATVACSPIIYYMSGEAVASNIAVDYFSFICER